MQIITNKNTGTMQIITGCMYSGKTLELINRINKMQSQGQITKVFKPLIDVRYHQNNVVSHNGNFIESIAIAKPETIFSLMQNATYIGIDEVQFFDKTIIDTCKKLIKLNINLIISGLEYDFLNNQFGYISNLLAFSNSVTKLSAICNCCGDDAFYTYKKNKSNTIIEIGETELYEARCYVCYQKGIKID